MDDARDTFPDLSDLECAQSIIDQLHIQMEDDELRCPTDAAPTDLQWPDVQAQLSVEQRVAIEDALPAARARLPWLDGMQLRLAVCADFMANGWPHSQEQPLIDLVSLGAIGDSGSVPPRAAQPVQGQPAAAAAAADQAILPGCRH